MARIINQTGRTGVTIGRGDIVQFLMDYLTDYIHSLTYDPTLEEITTIKELVECFETELYYIQQNLED